MFRVTIVGLGKIGLPLGVQFARQGMSVIGADINPAVVDLVRRGEPPFPGEANLDEYLGEVLAAKRFDATTDTAEAVRRSNVVVIVVPLVVDHDTKIPDFRAIDSATAAVARGLQPGTLVCYETTLPIGTTRNRFAVALSKASGLALGSELMVCFSPERVSSGRVFSDLTKYPKLVGGIDPASTARGLEFYRAGLTFAERTDLTRPNGVWEMGSAEASEMAKLAETTYRDINIAFANELARHCDRIGVDVGQVVEATNSQPFSHIHQPGVAVGGHCIPVYPHLYLLGDPTAQMPRASREVNDRMPAYCVEQLSSMLGSLAGAKVAVLGLAYRGGVKETAFSGCWPLVAELSAKGATVVVEDPLYTDAELEAFGLSPYHFGEAIDAAIVQADHVEYRNLPAARLPGLKALVDGRDIIGSFDSFTSADVSWKVLGRRSHRAGYPDAFVVAAVDSEAGSR
jgi:UDP-N-acetyl-D-glucosamine dehydrogenase